MQFFTTISLLLTATAAGVLAAPANYNQLAPSERALVDARALICGQYPHRDWVLIGTLKVDCNAVEKRDAEAEAAPEPKGKHHDDEFTVDKNWYVEYRGI